MRLLSAASSAHPRAGALVNVCAIYGCPSRRRKSWRRPAPGRARPDPGATGHRAAGEGQQLLLGARGQGRARAREHHRSHGVPVDAARLDRACLHRLGAQPLRRRLGGAAAEARVVAPIFRILGLDVLVEQVLVAVDRRRSLEYRARAPAMRRSRMRTVSRRSAVHVRSDCTRV